MLRYKLIVCFLLFSGVAFGQCTFEKFYKYYPTSNPAKTYTTICSDGGSMSTMSCYYDTLNPGQGITGDLDMAVVKLDSCGNLLWKDHYGEQGLSDDPVGCIETSTGEYLIGGTTEKGPALANFRIMKLSKNGAVVWDSIYNGITESVSLGMAKRQNRNSVFLMGYLHKRVGGGTYPVDVPFAMEIDENGYTLKRKEFINHISSGDYILSIFQPNDTNYDLLEYTRDSLYFIQTDTSFNVRISRPIIYTQVYYYSSCISRDNSKIEIAVTSVDWYQVRNDNIFEFDINGILKKSVSYPMSSFWGYPSYIYPTREGGFIMGTTHISMLDSNLNFQNPIWFNATRGSIYSVAQSTNGSIIASGMSSLLDSYGELYIVKTDSTGKFANNAIQENNNTKQVPISIYPNPATSILNIQTNINKKLTAQLFDVTGKAVIENVSFVNNTTINLQDLPQGLYFVYLKDAAGSLIKTQKVSVIK